MIPGVPLLKGFTKNSEAMSRIDEPNGIRVSPSSALSTLDPSSTISSARSERSSKYLEISVSVGYGALSLYVARGAAEITSRVLSQAVSHAARSLSEKEEPQLVIKRRDRQIARTRENFAQLDTTFIECPSRNLPIWLIHKDTPLLLSFGTLTGSFARGKSDKDSNLEFPCLWLIYCLSSITGPYIPKLNDMPTRE